MSEMDTKKDQLQIYKEKLLEIYQKNEELLSQNKKLQTEKDDLQSKFQVLNVNYEEVLAQNETLMIQSKEKESSVSVQHSMKARRRWFLILYLIIAIMAVATGVFFVKMKLFEDMYISEQAQKKQMDEALTTARKTQAVAEEELSAAYAALEEAEDEMNQLYEELWKIHDGDYGYSSSKLYTERDHLLLEVGQTETIVVHNPTYYMYAESSDEEALGIEQDNPYDSAPEVAITAWQPGIYTVNCAGYSDSYREEEYFEEDFDILVIVLEEDEKR